ncbi:MAG: alternative ribosome rescue factor ArfA [Hyphomicrobiaceae bacterium]
MAKRPGKPKAAKEKRNPVARTLSQDRYRPRHEQPRKGKGSYRRRKTDDGGQQ